MRYISNGTGNPVNGYGYALKASGKDADYREAMDFSSLILFL
jgi:hypothetical protein